MKFSEAFSLLAAKKSLDSPSARAAFGAILRGEWTPVQVGAFVASLRALGAETEEVIAAGAEAMREAMTPIAHERDVVIDTCGTGGDGSGSLNISTAAAIVVAACGVAVAKHGNRSVSSRCGSADVIEALGIPIDLTPDMQSALLRDVGITFLFAPAHHPALKHAGAARKELGVRTIFNALGPLANPARATHQLVGVYDDALRPVMARALGKLGVKRAWVVRAEDGLDEISTDAPTRVSELREDGTVHERLITADEFESPPKIQRSIEGRSADANATEIAAIFDRHVDEHPAKSSVVINAAAALLVAGLESDPRAATLRARAAIDRGDAKEKLWSWRKAARKLAGLE